jgi:hypothetical protein
MSRKKKRDKKREGKNKNQRDAKCMKQHQNKIRGTTGLKGDSKRSSGDQDVIDRELEEYRKQEEEGDSMRQDMPYSQTPVSLEVSSPRFRISSLDSRGFICSWLLQSATYSAPRDSYNLTALNVVGSSITDSSVMEEDTSSEGMFPGSKSKLILEAVIKMPLLFINSIHLLFPPQEDDIEDRNKRSNNEKSNENRESPSFSVMKSIRDSIDDSSLLIGSDTGLIIQVSRFTHCREDAVIYPGLTYHQFRDTSSFSAVTSIDLHPLDTNLFLVAYADGSVSLFEKTCLTFLSEPNSSEPQSPLMTWDSCDTQVSQELKVSWLPSSYSSFVTFARSSSSIVFWDMNISVWNPLFKYQLAK